MKCSQNCFDMVTVGLVQRAAKAEAVNSSNTLAEMFKQTGSAYYIDDDAEEWQDCSWDSWFQDPSWDDVEWYDCEDTEWHSEWHS